MSIKNLFENKTPSEILSTPIINKSLQTIIIILIIFIIAKIINKIIEKNVKQKKKMYYYKKLNSYISTITVLILVLMLWFSMIKSFAIMISIISAGIALALQEVILTIAGFLLIIFKKPFEIGDRIEINETIGDIIDIDMYHVTIIEVGHWVNGDLSTGRIVKIPNSEVFKYKIFNYTKGWNYVWDEFNVVITFESNFEKAEKLLLKILEKRSKTIEEEVSKELKKLSKKYLIIFNILTPKVYVKIGDSGIGLYLRYLVNVRERRLMTDIISREFLKAVNKEKDITLAYVTYRIVK